MKRYSTMMSVLLTLALPVAGSCADAPKGPEKAESSIEAVAESMSKTGHSRMMAGGTPDSGSEVTVSGRVVETMEGGGYSYANLEREGKRSWVAFPTLETRVGDELSFRSCAAMTGFQSKALNRKFETILFCGSPEIKTAQDSSHGTQVSAKRQDGGALAAPPDIKVDKAKGANAYTVQELYEKRAALDGKQVLVRGKVVKVSSGIMNRNWIHLQDGSGNEKDKNHDLVVTSSDLPAVGAVVTMSGTLAKDRDFGAGYRYDAIIENGRIQR